MTDDATEMAVPPRAGTIAVISPHLDDAVLSLGATIARWAREGARVAVVTVLANDPDLAGDASPWDRSGGFTNSRQAAESRRSEDANACAILGATPSWLPFGDKEHPRGGTEDEIRDALEQTVAGADVVVAPGYPLTQAGGDHLFVARVALTMASRPSKLGLYVEQPYAANRVVRRLARRAGPLPFQWEWNGWQRMRPRFSDWRAKQAAIASYESQHRILGPLLRSRIGLYELVSGGEAISWLRPSDVELARERIARAETALVSMSDRLAARATAQY
jgi:LmbE family N-acetylglucosaminyl deacetylase